ncbi:hypothetical protein LTR05_001380 [Lithohypha guttulata]|uniref:Uncharacterized protein n=1 Tax=Lithohypha guttulata TaxID=1690604 RepID=A0AAN7YAH5_9EURO|nr:hypothetical protein LTR05_001380 [Lithohypha guttulata]
MAGVMFALYTATLFAFTINFNKPPIASNTTTDEENQPSFTADISRNDSPTIQPGTARPPSVTQSLRVNTLPKDFEPKPQAQEHYLTPQQAAEAGIEPPTPIMKVQAIEKENGKEKSLEGEDKGKTAPQEESAVDDASISPIEESEKRI